jgi:Icc-related predicted phosphoesterase
MRSRATRRAGSPLLLISASLVLLLLLEQGVITPQSSNTTSIIPEFFATAIELVADNMGPLAPGVVEPEGCFNVSLREDIGSIRGIYAWTVSDANGSLVLYNYTLSARRVGEKILELCAPSDIVSGVYDVVIVASGQYVLPRSLWMPPSTLRKLRVAVFSDLHIATGSPTPREGDVNRIAASVVTHWIDPDLIIWAGDVTEGASVFESQVAQAYRYTYLYKYPVLSVPGNHDWPGSAYAKYLGPLRWVRVVENKLLIIGVFTAPQAGVEGVITPGEIAFLEAALVNYSHVPVKIIVFHYPMFFYQGELTTRYDDEEVLKPYAPGVATPVSRYWSPNMTAFRYVLKLIEDYNVTAVIAGHIHRDLFVKYTSTRTNTTTYFMTFTSTSHSVPLYNGVGLFEVDLETGEITFPIQPPGFTGFRNVTPPAASNSLPLWFTETTRLLMRVFHSASGYKAVLENRYPWYSNLSARLLWVFPWTASGQVVVETSALSDATVTLLDKLCLESRLFALVDLKLPRVSAAEISLFTLEDTSPPVVELSAVIPEVPRLNASLSLYFTLRDADWGINVEAVSVEFNGTRSSVQVIRPMSYISRHNNATLKVDLYVRGTNTTVTLLRIRVVDLSGKSTEKHYRVVFYPPRLVPGESPISEITISETTPVVVESPTPTQSEVPQYPEYPVTALAVVVVIVVTVALALTLYLLRTRK